MSGRRRILLTGGTGYLGGLVAATLLAHDDVDLVVPIRSKYDREGFLAPVRAEILARTGEFDGGIESRVHTIDLPPLDELDRLGPVVDRLGVEEVIHCAGCLDYFDTEMLEAVNVGFTRDLLAVASAHGVERFVYLSTAFSSGMFDGVVSEALHIAVGEDPTEYTRTKREAEWLVADSGLPHLILRPPIIIGDSGDGRYGGKRYGLYQGWAGMERLLFGKWYADVHCVAPKRSLPLLHQDAFQDQVLAALRLLPDGTVFNMVPPSCPTMRELAELWYPACMAPERIHCYERLEDVALLEIDRRQRAFLGLASTNIRISSHLWQFETPTAARLREQGVSWVDTSIDTVAVCQERFIRSSRTIMQFVTEHRTRFGREPEVVERCLSSNAS